MDASAWNHRYGTQELVWSSGPNQFLEAEVRSLPPRRAVDLACGEGRNAIWLAEQGWAATGVDFSDVGLAKAERLATQRGVQVEWVVSDVLAWAPPPGGYDLVAMCYLQLAEPARSKALDVAAAAVAPGGTLLVVAHDAANLSHGVGGPQDATVLYRADDVAARMTAAGLQVERAAQVHRSVEGAERPAIDTLVRATRPSAGPVPT